MKVKDALLRPWQEVVGTVDGVKAYDESIVISISWRRSISFEIPISKLSETLENLGQLLGQRTSLLRTDKDYIIKPCRQGDDEGSKVPRGCD